MQPAYKNIITLLLLTLFLGLRVGNAHTFLHSDEDTESTQCEMCDFITLSQEVTPAYDDNSSSKIEFNEPVEIAKAETEILYKEPTYIIVYPLFVHNKPPPSL